MTRSWQTFYKGLNSKYFRLLQAQVFVPYSSIFNWHCKNAEALSGLRLNKEGPPTRFGSRGCSLLAPGRGNKIICGKETQTLPTRSQWEDLKRKSSRKMQNDPKMSEMQDEMIRALVNTHENPDKHWIGSSLYTERAVKVYTTKTLENGLLHKT